MTTPGRAVKIVTRQRFVARSIKIFGTEADSSFFLSNSRISRSSLSSLPKSFLSAYHLERQSLLTATRRPIGLVFWPILFVGQSDFDVATALEDRAGGTAGLRLKTLESSGRTRDRFLDAEGFRTKLVVVFRVGDGGLEGLGHHTRAFAGHHGENGLRLQRGHALDLAHDFAHLLRGHRDVFLDRENFHKLFGLRLGCVGAVLLERAGQRKFTELVAHHVFGDEHRAEHFSIVDVERQTDKLRGDRRATRPRLDWRLGLGVLRLLDFVQQMEIRERTFFNRASHNYLVLSGSPLRRTTMKRLENLNDRRVLPPLATLP